MIRVLSVLAFMLLAGGATAQDFVLRSGEHDGFTRLVLEFDARPDWAAGRTEQGYILRLSGRADRPPDLSRAFDLIGRARVRDIAFDAANTALRVDLACACWADIKPLGDDLIILDIRNGAAPDAAPFETALTWPKAPGLHSILETAPQSPHPPTETANASAGAPVSTVDDRAPVRRFVTMAPLPSRDDLPAQLADLSTVVQTAATVAPSDRNTPSEPLQTLSDEVARAIAQGLLRPDGTPLNVSPRGVSAPPPLPNISVDTAIDRALGQPVGAGAAANGVGGCISPVHIDVAAWGHQDGIDAIGALRRDSIAEDGSLKQAGLLSLARHYIYLGFGAEARAAAGFLTNPTDKRVILGLADLVDHGKTTSTVFDAQFACAPEAAIWRAIAGPFQARMLPQNLDPMLSVFTALPLHHRVHLGPLLAERLRRAGLPEESRLALNTAVRGGTMSIRQDLASARLELTGTRADAARKRLVALAQGTGLSAAEALLELLDDARRRNVAPEVSWVDDAPSLIRATRGTEVSNALAVAAMRGGIALDQFSVVRRTLATPQGDLSPEQRSVIYTELIEAATERADDGAFLKAEVAFKKEAGVDRLTGESRRTTGVRLLSMGLAERALAYADTSVTPDDRYLRARILSRLGLHDQALALVTGSETETAQRLQAEIFSAAGQPLDAARAFLAAEDRGAGLKETIRAGDWTGVSRLTEESTSQDDAPMATETAGTNTQLLGQVATRRERLEQLLSDTEFD